MHYIIYVWFIELMLSIKQYLSASFKFHLPNVFLAFKVWWKLILKPCQMQNITESVTVGDNYVQLVDGKTDKNRYKSISIYFMHHKYCKSFSLQNN